GEYQLRQVVHPAVVHVGVLRRLVDRPTPALRRLVDGLDHEAVVGLGTVDPGLYGVAHAERVPHAGDAALLGSHTRLGEAHRVGDHGLVRDIAEHDLVAGSGQERVYAQGLPHPVRGAGLIHQVGLLPAVEVHGVRRLGGPV